jgi:Fis family transcriptional regulator, factor for inversion stimulation protein
MLNETLFKTDVKPESNSKNFSLYESVRSSVHNYLKSLEHESQAGNLYELILAEMEIPLFEKVLEYTNGFETRTAKILGIARGTLRTKLKEYNIDRRDYKWPKYRGELGDYKKERTDH